MQIMFPYFYSFERHPLVQIHFQDQAELLPTNLVYGWSKNLFKIALFMIMDGFVLLPIYSIIRNRADLTNILLDPPFNYST